MHDFKHLRVWQMASALALSVHEAVRQFPRSDRGVTGGQLRRAAESVPANIAEGCGVGSRKEMARYLKQASRSAMEVENHLLAASGLGFLHPKRAHALLVSVTSVQRMLAALIRKLPDDPPEGPV